LELDGKIVQYFKIAGPWDMRFPQHELLKLKETVQKSQHEPAHGKKESPGESPWVPWKFFTCGRTRSKQQLSDGMRCRDSHTLYPRGSLFY